MHNSLSYSNTRLQQHLPVSTGIKKSGTVITTMFTVHTSNQEELNHKLIIYLLMLTYSPG
jgi:hypothetical protein